MSNRHPSHKPRVSDVTYWHWTYWNDSYNPNNIVEVSVGVADNYPDYYKVLIAKSSLDLGNGRTSQTFKPKYFYGEMAWADVNRYVSDSTGWFAFDLTYGGIEV